MGIANKSDSRITTETLFFSAPPIEVPVMGDLKKKSSITWSDDKKSMIEIADYFGLKDGKQVEYTVTFSYTLSDDKKSLALKEGLILTSGSEPIKYSLEAVYDREN